MQAITRLDVYRPDRIKYLSHFAGSIDKAQKYAKVFPDLYERTSNGQVSMIYEQHENGRFYPKGLSMTAMNKEVRNWLAVEGAVDIDIINSAPVIITEVCRRHDVACVYFNDFVQHYHDYRNDVEDFKDLKNNVLFGSHPLRAHSPGWARRMRSERDIMVQELAQHYPTIMDRAIDKNADNRATPKRTRIEGEDDAHVDNVDGLFISYLYTREEGIVLQAMDEAGRSLGMWDDAVSWIHDGMMVHYPRDINLVAIEGYIADKTGVHVKLAFKPLTPVIDIDPTKFPDIIHIHDGHLEAAKYLCMALGDTYIRDQYDEQYVKSNGTWSNYEETVKDHLLKTCMGMNMKRVTIGKDEEEKLSLFSSMTDVAQRIVKAAKPMLAKCTNNDFAKDLVLGGEGKIFFKNGAWDFDQGMFINGDPTNTMRRIIHDFPPRIQTDIDFVMDNIINPIFDTTEDGTVEVFLQAVSRAIAGKMDKATYIVFGPRNSGKSLLFQLVAASFGRYVGTVPSATFAVGHSGGGDAFRGNGFMVSIEHTRVVKMSELPPDNGKSKVKLDGSKIKIFQSMKEGVEARALNKMQKTYYSLGTGFFLLNDVPEFSPADSFDQCILFELPNQFVSPDQMPTGPKEFWTHDEAHRRLAVPDVEKWIQQPKVCNAFIHIILHAYKETRVEPLPSMIAAKHEMAIGTGDDAYEAVVEVTMEKEDVVVITDLRDALASVGIKDNNAVIGRTIARMIGNRFSAERLTAPTDMKGRVLKRGDVNFKKTVYRYIRLVKGRVDNTIGLDVNPNEGGGGAYARGFDPHSR